MSAELAREKSERERCEKSELTECVSSRLDAASRACEGLERLRQLAWVACCEAQSPVKKKARRAAWGHGGAQPQIMQRRRTPRAPTKAPQVGPAICKGEASDGPQYILKDISNIDGRVPQPLMPSTTPWATNLASWKKKPGDRSSAERGTALSGQAEVFRAEAVKGGLTKKGQRRGEGRMQKIAVKVMQLIGQEQVKESAIRMTHGNTPDISKALRLLLSTNKVVRSGSGGRTDPYVYEATLQGLHDLLNAASPPHETDVRTTQESGNASVTTLNNTFRRPQPLSAQAAQAVSDLKTCSANGSSQDGSALDMNAVLCTPMMGTPFLTSAKKNVCRFFSPARAARSSSGLTSLAGMAE